MLQTIKAFIITVHILTHEKAACMCVCVYTHIHLFRRQTQQTHKYYFSSYIDRLNPVVQINNSNANEATCFSLVVSNHQV